MKTANFSLFGGARTPVLLQSEAAECGLACLAMIANHHGYECSLSALRLRMEVSLRGMNLPSLIRMADDLKLSSRAVRLELPNLTRLKTPCVLHWDMDHFVVLERATSTRAWIIDPAIGRRCIAMADLSKRFTGIALEIYPAEEFRPAKEKSGLRLSTFFHGVVGIRTTMAKLLLLSLSIQVTALLLPFFSQLVIDEVVASQDLSLLNLLALSFGTLVLIDACIAAVRAFVILYFGGALQFEWAHRLLHHLLRLPLAFFEKRHMGDIQSRFRSLADVQNLATNTIVEGVIDGVMALTTLVVMFVYGPILALVPLTALTVYMLVRMAAYRAQRDAAQLSLVEAAKQGSHFLETLRGILAIKSFAKESNRESVWQNRVANAVRANVASEGYNVAQNLTSKLLFSLENVLVLWLGARAVIDGGLSVGMLVAFLAFKLQFTTRASALIDKLLQFRLISVHLDRLADIALAQQEDGLDAAQGRIVPTDGHIEIRDVSFRYSANDPPVIDRANLSIAPGECVAIFAPSGTGKTTLLKIMMSLLRPESGQVLVDGQDIHRGQLTEYRRRIASVMQEDALMSGTLSDNIAFFDAQPDPKRIEECSKLAAVHEDIMRMPMGYATLVGDMGAALSGGQKQRVLLARALYATPRILFLDEATSHVDGATEKSIHAALASLDITRIIITHRRETLAIADRVLSMADIQSPEMSILQTHLNGVNAPVC